MGEPKDITSKRSGGGSGWEELDLRFDSLRELETDFVQYLATDGLFVPTADPLPPSSVVRLRLLLPDDFVLLEGTGVVFWVREADVSGPAGLPPGMAIRFAALGQQHQDMVDRLIRSVEERGGKPFDLDQAVAAAEAPAPSPKRDRTPEVARLQVRGDDRPAAPVAAPVEPGPDDESVPWAERTISLGVPPIQALESRDAMDDATGPVVGPSPSPAGSELSVDATLQIAWARAEAFGAVEEEKVGPDPTPSELPAPVAAPEDERPVQAAPSTTPTSTTDARGPEEPLAPAATRRPPPVTMPEPEPVVMPENEAEAGDELETGEPARRSRGMRRLVAVTAGLGVVATIAVALLLLDPLGWRSGDEATDAEPEAPASAAAVTDGPPQDPSAPAPTTSMETGAAEPMPTGAGTEIAEVPERPDPNAVVLQQTAPAPPPSGRPASRVIDIRWVTRDGATEVTVVGDGRLEERRVSVEPLSGPPRILLRMAGIEEGYARYTLDVGTPELLRIRTGHHPELSPPSLFVVLDLADDLVVVEGVGVSGDTARVTVARRPR